VYVEYQWRSDPGHDSWSSGSLKFEDFTGTIQDYTFSIAGWDPWTGNLISHEEQAFWGPGMVSYDPLEHQLALDGSIGGDAGQWQTIWSPEGLRNRFEYGMLVTEGVWIAVPEPSTIVLLLLPLAWFALRKGSRSGA